MAPWLDNPQEGITTAEDKLGKHSFRTGVEVM